MIKIKYLEFEKIIMNEEYILKIYSNRWKRYDDYTVRIINDGWHISYMGIGGKCTKNGEPYLFKNLNQDLISYPRDLNYVMEVFWNTIFNNRLNSKKINHKFEKIAKWIYLCERKKPNFQTQTRHKKM